MRRPLLVFAFTAAAFTACDSYPAAFPPIDRGVLGRFAFGCADINGTYIVEPAVRSDQLAFRESFLRDLLTQPGAYPLSELITIAGNARDSLTVTVWRSDTADAGNREWTRLQDPAVRWSAEFKTLSDAEYAAMIEQVSLRNERQHVLHRGAEYDCGGGWVRGPRTVHDPGPDRREPRPDAVNGEVLLARGKDGSLIAQSEHAASKELTLWCGDGCRGVPLGTSVVRRWDRWQKGAPFVHPSDPRRWAVPPPAVAPQAAEASRAPVSGVSRDDIASRATACLIDGVTITAYDVDGEAMLLSVSYSTYAALGRFLSALGDDPVFADPELKWVVGGNPGGGNASVRVSKAP